MRRSLPEDEYLAIRARPARSQPVHLLKRKGFETSSGRADARLPRPALDDQARWRLAQ